MKKFQVNYRAFLEAFPELHEEQVPLSQVSPLVADFSPEAVIGEVDPWVVVSNRSAFPKQKKIVISFSNLENTPFEIKKNIDNLVSFLMSVGFTVLIVVDQRLEAYKNQFFNQANLSQVGNLTRGEIQNLATKQGIIADQLFFIDDKKIENDPKFVDTFTGKLQSLERETIVESEPVHVISFIDQDVGSKPEVHLYRNDLFSPVNDNRWHDSCLIVHFNFKKGSYCARLHPKKISFELVEVLSKRIEKHSHPVSIDFSLAELPDDSFKILARIVSNAKNTISMSGLALSKEDLFSLIDMIQGAQHRVFLDLSQYHFDNADILHLMKIVKRSSFDLELNILLNEISDDSALVIQMMVNAGLPIKFHRKFEGEGVLTISKVALKEAVLHIKESLRLDLQYIPLGNEGSYVDSLMGCKEVIDIDRSCVDQISDDEIKALANLIDNANNKILLNLGNNKISSYGIRLLAAAISKTRQSIALYLSGVDISEEDICSLAGAASDAKEPITLGLGYHPRSVGAVKAIAQAILKANHEIVVDLSAAHIGLDHIKVMAVAIEQASHPVNLNLSWNELNEACFQVLANAIRNSSCPVTLDLSFNYCDEKGVAAIARGVEESRVPVTLNLKNNDIDSSVRKKLLALTSSNYENIRHEYESYEGLIKPFLFIASKVDSRHEQYSGVNCLHIAHSITLSCFSAETPMLFSSLRELHCLALDDVLNIYAEQLIDLKLIFNPEVRSGADLRGFPFLGRLVVGFNEKPSKDFLPVFIQNENLNLEDIVIYGQIARYEWIREIITCSPNLKKIEFSNTAISPQILQNMANSFPEVVMINDKKTLAPYVESVEEEESDDVSVTREVQDVSVFTRLAAAVKKEGEDEKPVNRMVYQKKVLPEVLSNVTSSEVAIGDFKPKFSAKDIDKIEVFIKKMEDLVGGSDHSVAINALISLIQNLDGLLPRDLPRQGFFNQSAVRIRELMVRASNLLLVLETFQAEFVENVVGEKKELAGGVTVDDNLPNPDIYCDINTRSDLDVHFKMKAVAAHISGKRPQRFLRTRDAVFTLNDRAQNVELAQNYVSNPLPKALKISATDPLHDYYAFSMQVHLEKNQYYSLTSLSAHDEVVQLMINGSLLSEEQIELYKSEQGFYRIKPRVRLEGILHYTIDTAGEVDGKQSDLPADVGSLIRIIQRFPSADVAALDLPKNTTEQEALEAMFEQKKGRCSQRVRVFLYKFNQLKNQSDETKVLYENIRVRGVARGGVHHNIEISSDAGLSWKTIDLGGYEAVSEYQSIVLPRIPFATKAHEKKVKFNFSQVMGKIRDTHQANFFLQLKNKADIHLCLLHIKKKCREEPKRVVFYVDSPEELRAQKKRIYRDDNDKRKCKIVEPPTGLLHAFLIENQSVDPPPVIVVNWDNFSIGEIVQLNSIIDDIANRRADGMTIPVGATIVGLHAVNDKLIDLLCDSSFVSRHVSAGIHDLTGEPIASLIPFELNKNILRSQGEVIEINLHQSPRWHDILLGKAVLNGDSLYWEDGRLLPVIKNQYISVLHVINPPVNDLSFKNFIDDLRVGESFVLANEFVNLDRALVVDVETSITFLQKRPLKWSMVSSLIENAFIINSATFEQCLHGKRFDDHFLYLDKGIIDAHYEKYQDDIAAHPLVLCICENLTDSQWSLLLEKISAHNIELHVFALPGVRIPQGIQVEMTECEAFAPRSLVNRFISSNDVEYSVFQEMKSLSSESMIIDFSELTIDDLLCKIDHEFVGNHFRFTKKFSSVWEALSKGETVILKGSCSRDMFDYLITLFGPSPYFYLEGVKHTFSGSLIVISDNDFTPPIWFEVEKQFITTAQKRDVLMLSPVDNLVEEPFIRLSEARVEQSYPAFVPLAIHSVEHTHYSEEQQSKLACEIFEQNRMMAVKHILAVNSFVVLEGAPGVGKSYFVRALESDPGVDVYREHQIKKWASSKPELIDPQDPESRFKQKILFRDEINLRSTDCSQDRDLLNPQPSIFIDGQYYVLSKHHKVMYAQNPNTYGGGRHEPMLFRDLPDCKYVFNEMSEAFILHRILKPIFEITFSGSSQDDAGQSEAYRRATKVLSEHGDMARSIRDLQTIAIFECALHGNQLPPLPEVGVKEICFGNAGFVLTPSRVEVYRDVLRLIRAREFRRSLNDKAYAGAKYNGVNGLVLEGPPGVGKSEFIKQVLASEGYVEATAEMTREELASEKVYYQLRGLSENQKILDDAFQNGAILIIDEIDTCKLIENYLNAYLTGEDLKGDRAKVPGFTVLSTANGTGNMGRRELSKPIKSRLLHREFKEYARHELIQILEVKYVALLDPGVACSSALIERKILKKQLISYIVDDFLTQQNTPNNEMRPTFRELDYVAQHYFSDKFDLLSNVGFSLEEHKFILAFSKHAYLDQLIRAFVSGELDVKKTSPAQMKRYLEDVKGEAYGQGKLQRLFQPENQSAGTAESNEPFTFNSDP